MRGRFDSRRLVRGFGGHLSDFSGFGFFLLFGAFWAGFLRQQVNSPFSHPSTLRPFDPFDLAPFGKAQGLRQGKQAQGKWGSGL